MLTYCFSYYQTLIWVYPSIDYSIFLIYVYFWNFEVNFSLLFHVPSIRKHFLFFYVQVFCILSREEQHSCSLIYFFGLRFAHFIFESIHLYGSATFYRSIIDIIFAFDFVIHEEMLLQYFLFFYYTLQFSYIFQRKLLSYSFIWSKRMCL